MKRKILVVFAAILALIVGLYAAGTSEILTITDTIGRLSTNREKTAIVLTTLQSAWTVVDTTTSAGSEPNDLTAANSGRTYNMVLADSNSGALEVSIVNIPSTWNAVKFRLLGTTADATVTYQVYAGTKSSSANFALVNVGQLAWTIGTQVSDISGYNFADQVTVTSYTTTKSWISYSAANERCAQATIDLEGENVLVLVPTVVNCDCKLLAKGY